MSEASNAGTGGTTTGATSAGGAGTAGAGGQMGGQAGAGAGGSNAGGATGVPNSLDWTSGFNEDARQFVQGKGFKDPATVVESYRQLEKLIGVKEKLIKLPEKDDDVAGWNEVYDKLGRPKYAKEYNIPVPEKGDKSFAEWAQGTFHELGISRKAGEALAAKWNDLQASKEASQLADYTKTIEADGATLKKEWGAAYDKHVAMAKQAAKAFDVPGEIVDKLEAAMGHAGTMKFFAKLGSKLGEDNFVGGGSDRGFGALTPEAAQHQIKQLRNDTDFVRRYTAGDTAARQKMDQLHSYAYPDQNTA